MTEICVFAESTITADEVCDILGDSVDVRPSVRCGDVLKAVLDGCKWIVIIDGSFEWTPSVWHKEILFALRQGVQVFGCSSMGALRAAELSEFGMIGVGSIYNAYNMAVVTSDDEVAIKFDKVSQESTIPLINVRLSLGDLSIEKNREIFQATKAIHYSERTWKKLHAVLSEADYRYLKREYRDFKKSDAIDCLTDLKKRFSLDSVPNRCVQWAETSAFKRLIELSTPRTVLFKNFLDLNRGNVLSQEPVEGLVKCRALELCKFIGIPPIYAQDLETFISKADARPVRFSKQGYDDCVTNFRIREGLVDKAAILNWCVDKNLETSVLPRTLDDYFEFKKSIYSTELASLITIKK